MKVIKYLGVLIFLSCLHPVVFAQSVQDTKAIKIRRLMEVSGVMNTTKSMYATMMPHLFKELRATVPDIPDRVIQIMEKESWLPT